MGETDGLHYITFSSRWLPDLTGLINAHIAQVPPGWTVTEQQVAAVLDTPSLWNAHYPEETAKFAVETLCVIDQERLAAAAQWGYPVECESTRATDSPAMGFISWITAAPGNGPALSLLLDNLIVRCRERKCRGLGTGRYAFGVGWMGVSTLWPHLITGFEQAGFSRSHRWVIMMGTTDVPVVAAPKCVAPMRIDWRVDEIALEWELRLYADDQLIGECEAWGIPRHLAECDGYAGWITFEWLGVESPYQRQGIGRWLLSEQLRRQAQRRIANAIFWTEPDNRAMRHIGESLGFGYGPECWVFEKTIQ